MSKHAEVTLVRLIKRSVAALRLAVDDLRIEASKIGVQRVCEECETLSGAVAQIARLVDLTKLDPPKPVDRSKGKDLLEQAQRFLSAMEHGFCATCGGVPRQPSDHQSQVYRVHELERIQPCCAAQGLPRERLIGEIKCKSKSIVFTPLRV